MVDVGCGVGFSTTYFRDRGARVLCVEGSHDAVSNTLLPLELVVEHDFSRGAYWPEQLFDAAWCVEFTEHVGRMYQQNYFATFRRAALIFMTASPTGGWHHVEQRNSWWWIARMEMQVNAATDKSNTLRNSSIGESLNDLHREFGDLRHGLMTSFVVYNSDSDTASPQCMLFTLSPPFPPPPPNKGFKYSTELTEVVRLNAEFDPGRWPHSNGGRIQPGTMPYGQYIANHMMVFINPAIASLPRFHHLISGHGCHWGHRVYGDQRECDGQYKFFNAEVDTAPREFEALLSCRNVATETPGLLEEDGVHYQSHWHGGEGKLKRQWAAGPWGCVRNGPVHAN